MEPTPEDGFPVAAGPTPPRDSTMHGLYVTLASIWTWLGIVFVILSLFSWLYVLRHMPLSTAFPLSNVVHVLVPLSCWIFLHELISTRRWCGIALVLIGLAVVAKPFSRIEEKL